MASVDFVAGFNQSDGALRERMGHEVSHPRVTFFVRRSHLDGEEVLSTTMIGALARQGRSPAWLPIYNQASLKHARSPVPITPPE